mmetsp:Transcript_48105/g.108370  ORF Transcript_48105/g.108370 Transcript_48105/m.108370 type:complete len:225 (-) Transcript_48105:422-1096(-)
MEEAAVLLLRRCEQLASTDPRGALQCAAAVTEATGTFTPPISCLAHLRAGELFLQHTEELERAANHFIAALGICTESLPPPLLLATLCAATCGARTCLVEGQMQCAQTLINLLQDTVRRLAALPAPTASGMLQPIATSREGFQSLDELPLVFDVIPLGLESPCASVPALGGFELQDQLPSVLDVLVVFSVYVNTAGNWPSFMSSMAGHRLCAHGTACPRTGAHN